MIGRYKFDTIFTYNPLLGIITPKFNVLINGVPFNRGVSIYRSTSFGGLNLFNYIGRDIAGIWNAGTQTLTISGFY